MHYKSFLYRLPPLMLEEGDVKKSAPAEETPSLNPDTFKKSNWIGQQCIFPLCRENSL